MLTVIWIHVLTVVRIRMWLLLMSHDFTWICKPIVMHMRIRARGLVTMQKIYFGLIAIFSRFLKI